MDKIITQKQINDIITTLLHIEVKGICYYEVIEILRFKLEEVKGDEKDKKKEDKK